MNYVTDTHALLWWFTDSPKLGPEAANLYLKYERGEIIIFIPTIVMAEALSIFERRRIPFDFKKLFKKIRDSENYALVALDNPILKQMIVLKDIHELHDKIIVATALYLGIPLITRDANIQNLSYIRTIW